MDGTDPAEVSEEEYERVPIPDGDVADVAGRPRRLASLASDHAALLLYVPTEGDEGQRLVARVPAFLADVVHLSVRCVVASRGEVAALPLEARASALIDTDQWTRRAWGIAPDDTAAVLLGVDDLLAGGPVFGAADVVSFATDVRQAILGSWLQNRAVTTAQDPASSIDVIIPFRHASPQRLRNLAFTIGYYRRHLPDARVILVEENRLTTLPDGVVVDQHLTVPGDPDLFNKSALMNAAAAESRATYLVFADADCIPEVAVLASLEGICRAVGPSYLVPHDQVHYLTHGATHRFIREGGVNDGDVGGLKTHQMAVTVGGVTVCHAASFAAMGGFDQQRFLGWGAEDDDLYNRFYVSPNHVWRVESNLVHLDHPDTVWHSFSAQEMDAKRAAVPPASIPTPASKVAAVRDWFRDRRVRLATNSLSPSLFSMSRGFSQRVFDDITVVDGTAGTYGLVAFRALVETAIPWSYDYLLYTDEDNVIVDWLEVQRTFESFIDGGYGFAGMPDGGVISHRFHNPIAINPFMAFIDLRQARLALATGSGTNDRFGRDLVHHWPGHLVRAWDGTVPYRRVDVVLEEGYVPYGTALDDFEPYYSLWFQLLRNDLAPMYLAARDAPEMDDDGACTALLGTSGAVMSYHTWFARAHGHDPQQTVRINKVFERARSHLRW